MLVEPWLFKIYPAEEVISLNKQHEIGEFLPGYFAFGNNLGLEIFVFNTRESKPWKVYYAPNIGMEEDQVLECTEDFETFVKAMGRSYDDAHRE